MRNTSLLPRSVITVALSAILAPLGCANTLERPDGWTEATHGKDTPPNYALLFDATRVHEVRITIGTSDFRRMQEDLASLVGPGNTRPPTPPPEVMEACSGLAIDAPCSFSLDGNPMSGTCQTAPDGQVACTPGSGQPPGEERDVSLIDDDPIYVPVRVEHDGHVWTYVGMRYKGNSSLVTSYQQGIGKLPFRLDFDEFEGAHPEIDDQRFYGFKKLTFSSNWGDESQIRECFVKELFRDRGVPAPACAFYRVTVDVGEGPSYWGLYAAIEDPSDGAMLDAQFGGRGGNLYKPEGEGAAWTHFDQASFVKKSNEAEGDFSDVRSAIEALHAEGLAPEAWRAGLEARFQTDRFLRWLAVNTVIVNWDSYGKGPHNYYVYGDPGDGGRLAWVPWDHNLAMMSGPPGGGPGPQGPSEAPSEEVSTAAEEIFHTQVGADWPLISKLLADETLAASYRRHVQEALEGLGGEAAAVERMKQMHDLVRPHVVGDEGELATHTTVTSEEAFLDAVEGPSGLATFYRGRHVRVREALEGQ